MADTGRRKSLALPICVGALVALALLAGGYGYYRSEMNRIRKEQFQNLSTVADFKVGQIVRWRRVRLDDTRAVADNPFVGRAVADWLRRSEPADVKTDFLKLLTAEISPGSFVDARLLDRTGHVLLSVNSDSGPLAPACSLAVNRAIAGRCEVLSDLYRSPLGCPCLDAIAPILDSAGDARAVVVIGCDVTSSRGLYSLIQTWPTASPSAEALLVRRDGDDVLFLNDVRHWANSALSLRIPLTRTGVPAVEAVLGTQGVVEGTDYRGVRVLADLRPVPESPWWVVTKVDADEVFAEGRYRAWVIGVSVVLLIVIGVLATIFVYRRRESGLLRSLLSAERKRREEQEKFRALAANLPHMVCVKDRALTYTYVNENYARDLGRTPEEFVGKDVYAFYPPEVADKRQARDREVVESGRTSDTEEGIEVNGATRWVQAIRVPMRDQGGNVVGLLGLYWDITDRKRADESLKNALTELSRSNAELEQFAYVASHDLQEPLRMVASYTQLLAERYGDKLDQDARDFIRFAVDGASRMQRLILGLLAYSRVTKGGGPIEHVDVHAVLGEAVANLQASIHETGALVTSDDLPVVAADRAQLAQVLQNLIGNAIKFRKPGGPPLIHVSAERSRENGRLWTFRVRDNGIGIDPKYFDRLFVLFQRLHATGEYPGAGIGLALVKRIVERHGGTIWLESQPGLGTTVLFTLPGFTDGKERTSWTAP